MAKLSQKQVNLEKLICGGLLVLAFIFLSINSFREYKQTKEIPKRIEKLEKEVKQLSKKLKERPNEPYREVKLPHPAREVAEIPIIKELDNITYCTGMVMWYD